MSDQFSRTRLLLGDQAMQKLSRSRVAVFGVGGVGGYVAEALARSGVGALDLIDHDQVSLSNINRQIIALHSTIGEYKVDVMKSRTAKIQLVLQAKEAGVPVISSMGAGNKLDPAGFEVADIYRTSVCPLARVMRRELKKRGVEKLKVVYSICTFSGGTDHRFGGGQGPGTLTY